MCEHMVVNASLQYTYTSLCVYSLFIAPPSAFSTGSDSVASVTRPVSRAGPSSPRCPSRSQGAARECGARTREREHSHWKKVRALLHKEAFSRPGAAGAPILQKKVSLKDNSGLSLFSLSLLPEKE